ncbi:hypothetical protein [Negadavirga shengliensis]|uniref:Outer membrane efflux protein n=1 Tax=Negadavirga shengliensis TaxID=1389218 RepID=A0ABV9T1A6_9BACT
MGILYVLAFWTGVMQDSLIVTSGAVLATAFEDESYVSLGERIDYYQRNSHHVSYLDHMELRTRTRNFNPREQMYRFRTYTNSPSERKYSREYLNTSFLEQELEKKDRLNKLIKQRYHLIARKISDQRQLAVMMELETLFKERKTVFERSISNLDFDFQDLLKAEEEYDRFVLELIELERSTKHHDQELGDLLGLQGPLAVSDDGLVSAPDIENFLKNVQFDVEQENFYYDRKRIDKELAELDFLEKRASQRNPVKFFEASYRDVLGAGIERALAVGIGFRIPVGSAGKGSLIDRQFRIMKEESMLKETSLILEEEISQKIHVLETLLKKYNTLSGMIEGNTQQRSLEKYRSIEGLSPLILLKVKENILLKQQMAIALEKEILTEYIELLDLSGWLVKEPFVNYFSSSELLLIQH